MLGFNIYTPIKIVNVGQHTTIPLKYCYNFLACIYWTKKQQEGS